MKQVLLSLCGLTPQILTETLYCMMVQEKIALEEIWLVSTRSGRNNAVRQLFSNGDGRYYQFCRDYGFDPQRIRFTADHILAPGDLSDIQNVHDNESFANVLTAKVWALTQEPDSVLHCSIAGGRKTMSAYLAMIMQFFARPLDRLFHILTGSPDFENNPDFYYPPPVPQEIRVHSGGVVNTRDAGLVLVDIPFIRLRDKILEFQQKYYSFSEMVAIAQQWIMNPTDLPVLTMMEKDKTIFIGSDLSIRLPELRFSLYKFFVQNSLDRPDVIPAADYERYFIRGGRNMPMNARQRLVSIDSRYDLKDEDFIAKIQQEISKINRQIKETASALPFLDFYLISRVGHYGERKYGVKLDKKFIQKI